MHSESRMLRKWNRRAGRARSNLFCLLPTFFLGRVDRYWGLRHIFVARWGFWEVSVETWREEDTRCRTCDAAGAHGTWCCKRHPMPCFEDSICCMNCGHRNACHPHPGQGLPLSTIGVRTGFAERLDKVGVTDIKGLLEADSQDLALRVGYPEAGIQALQSAARQHLEELEVA